MQLAYMFTDFVLSFNELILYLKLFQYLLKYEFLTQVLLSMLAVK